MQTEVRWIIEAKCKLEIYGGFCLRVVRSSEMDKFFPEQLLRMELGRYFPGHKNAEDFPAKSVELQ